MITCTRRFSICAGHRVMGHENKCGHLHGHNYEICVTAVAPSLDKCGRTIDFSVLKEVLGEWLEENWDHGFIVHKDDKQALHGLRAFADTRCGGMLQGQLLAAEFDRREDAQKIYLMPVNPTAENMADYLLRVRCPVLFFGYNILITQVFVGETPNCSASSCLTPDEIAQKLASFVKFNGASNASQ